MKILSHICTLVHSFRFTKSIICEEKNRERPWKHGSTAGGHEEGILMSKTWKLVVFILTWVDSWQHRAMKCFRKAWCEEKMCEKISENKELGSEPWGGRDSRPRQSQQAALTLPFPPFTIFLTPSPTATRGMQADEQLFLPSIHSSVCVCVRDLKTERKLTSFDRLLVRTRPFLLGDGDSRISEHLYQIRKGHHFSCEFLGYSWQQTQLWRWCFD